MIRGQLQEAYKQPTRLFVFGVPSVLEEWAENTPIFSIRLENCGKNVES
jgi:hypothetical protein